MDSIDIDPRDSHEPDPAFDRLKAADVAATAEPDTTVIRAKVDAAISTSAPVVDLSAQRTKRRPARWLQVAAAAVGVVAVGGGAFVAGQNSAPAPISAQAPSSTVGASPEPLAQPEGQAAAGGFAADAPVAGAEGRSASTSMDMLGGFVGRTAFASEGLSGATANAQAWGYDPAATFTAETAARLAAALGVTGEPTLNYGAWHVGSLDWTTPSIDLSSDGLSSFSYSNPEIQPWSEKSTTAGATSEDATAVVTDLMVAIGVDPAGYTITADTQDPSSTMVVATPSQVSDGNGTWYASVTTDGLVNVNGSLAPRVDLGSYEVVSPQTAVDRLSDRRFGAAQSFSTLDMGVSPLARDMVDPAFGVDDPAAVPTLPEVAVPGGTIAWPVTNVTITAATLGTSSYVQPDGSVALLPTYTLTGSDGSAWTVLAVADAHLDFTAS